jgi:hypothetical protein
MAKTFGFFDSCTIQPRSDNSGLTVAEKMSPVRRALAGIFRQADRLGAPILATSCLGILRGNPELSVPQAVRAAHGTEKEHAQGGVAYVPLQAREDELAHALTCHRIVFERRGCKTPDENVRYRTFDLFAGNPHASEIVRRLGPRHWLVFGAGFDHCLVTAAEGLRGLGMEVSVLRDGCINGGRATPAATLETYQRIVAAGAKWESLSEATGLVEAVESA